MSDFAARAFERLNVGDAATTRARTITESDIGQFSNLTWDIHPLHTDATTADEGPFGSRIAHGMLILSFAVGLLPISPEHVLAMRRVRDVTFKRPVRIGDTIHCELKIVALDAVDTRAGLATMRLRVLNQEDRLVTVATLEALWACEGDLDQPTNGEIHVGTSN